jgi:hypothetical protein
VKCVIVDQIRSRVFLEVTSLETAMAVSLVPRFDDFFFVLYFLDNFFLFYYFVYVFVGPWNT